MKTLIIDGNNLSWRAYHAIRAELTTGGKPVKVVYGFLRSLRDALDVFEPDRAIVCWDEGKPAYRLSIYPLYKAHRHSGIPKEIAERKDVYSQIKVLKTLLPLLGVVQASYPDTEADDLIATASKMKKLGLRIIFSGDKDFLQLVKKGVRVYSPNHSYVYKWSTFKKKTGLTPYQYFEMRILSGDASDGIPAVQKGIGEKTAYDLIQIGRIQDLLTDEKCKKKVSKMSSRHNLIYLPNTGMEIMKNIKLMDLHTVHNESALAAIFRTPPRQPLNIPAIKQEFLDRQFRSILAEFGSWIVPFKGLR